MDGDVRLAPISGEDLEVLCGVAGFIGTGIAGDQIRDLVRRIEQSPPPGATISESLKRRGLYGTLNSQTTATILEALGVAQNDNG